MLLAAVFAGGQTAFWDKNGRFNRYGLIGGDKRPIAKNLPITFPGNIRVYPINQFLGVIRDFPNAKVICRDFGDGPQQRLSRVNFLHLNQEKFAGIVVIRGEIDVRF